MKPATACPACGAALSQAVPGGLCTRCLIGKILDPPAPDDAEELRSDEPGASRDFGGYRLLEEIARGGMGVVYRARQRRPARTVAIKIISGGELAAPSMVERFHAESTAAASLDHPNIVPIYEVGRQDGQHYFSMRLIEGQTLAAMLAGRSLPARQAAALLATVARAVHYAHQRGILHRDLKPGNILMDAEGVPHLTDFGLAKILESDTGLTVSGMVLGTPSYMSPEQAEGKMKEMTTASDGYSLGAVLYETLTGRPPFGGDSVVDVVRQVVETDPVRPTTVNPAVPSDLETIALKCLQKEPIHRYGSAEALAEDLERWLRCEPILARPATTREVLVKWVRRHPGRTAGLIALVALLLTLLGGSLAFSLRLKKERDRADTNARTARAEQANTRQALARAQTALAEAAYRELDGLGMKAALDAVPEDLRDSTWHYLATHADTSQATQDGAFVGAAADPTRPGVFAVAEQGRGIALVDAKTGARLQQFSTTPRQRRQAFHRGLAVSPDGQRLAVGGLGDCGLALYDLRAGSPLLAWEAPETDLLEFSRDGQRLLQTCSTNQELCLWEAPTGRLLWRQKHFAPAVFDPVDEQIVAAHGNELVILDAATGSQLRQLARFRASVHALVVRRDGRMVVCGDTEGYVHGVELKEGRILFGRPASDRGIRSLDFTADGRRFVTVTHRENQRQVIQVWDAMTGTPLQSLLGGSGRAETLRIHPHSDDLLVTGPHSKSWALSTKAPRWVLPGASTAAFFGGEASCLSRTENGVAQFQLSGSEQVIAWTTEGSGSWNLAVSANGLVMAATRFGIWSFESRLLRHGRGDPEPIQTVSGKFAVSFARLSPAGDRILFFVPGGKCSGQFDTATGADLPWLDDERPILQVNDVQWLDGSRVIGAVIARGWRGTPQSEEQLVLWDATSGKRIRSERSAALIDCLATAPDSRSFAEAGDDKLICIRDAATLAVQGRFRAHDASITSLAWHPTRPILASASADLTIKLWEIPGGRLLEELRGPVKPVTALSFSPGGGRLLSASADQTRIWEPAVLQAGPAPRVPRE